MGNKRKQRSAEFKAQVAMAALSGDKTLAAFKQQCFSTANPEAVFQE